MSSASVVPVTMPPLSEEYIQSVINKDPPESSQPSYKSVLKYPVSAK